jgi:ActR/RegA family two-component response regulator
MNTPNRYKLIALDKDLTILKQVADYANPLFETLRVRDAARAIALCNEDPMIRVIVTEHVIHQEPNVSLLDLLRVRHEHIRRVMLTTYADLSAIVTGLHTGSIQALVRKPINPNELLAAIGQPPAPFAAVGDTAAITDSLSA